MSFLRLGIGIAGSHHVLPMLLMFLLGILSDKTHAMIVGPSHIRQRLRRMLDQIGNGLLQVARSLLVELTLFFESCQLLDELLFLGQFLDFSRLHQVSACLLGGNRLALLNGELESSAGLFLFGRQ